jgi:hypothetical protein
MLHFSDVPLGSYLNISNILECTKICNYIAYVQRKDLYRRVSGMLHGNKNNSEVFVDNEWTLKGFWALSHFEAKSVIMKILKQM